MNISKTYKQQARETLKFNSSGRMAHVEMTWKGVEITGIYDRGVGLVVDLFPKSIEFSKEERDFFKKLFDKGIGLA